MNKNKISAYTISRTAISIENFFNLLFFIDFI